MGKNGESAYIEEFAAIGSKACGIRIRVSPEKTVDEIKFKGYVWKTKDARDKLNFAVYSYMRILYTYVIYIHVYMYTYVYSFLAARLTGPRSCTLSSVAYIVSFAYYA